MIRTDLEHIPSFPALSAAALQTSALQASAPIVLALVECEEELRAEAIELFKQLASGELDEEQRFATAALLVEILFPNADSKGTPGLDLVEAEEIASSVSAETKDILAQMDKEESFFADRLRELMKAKGLTQADLAAKVGIGQSAISMMLNRACRPQRKSVLRLAQALEVPAEELWPQSSRGIHMPVNNADVGLVVQICQQHCHRVRYGVLGAAISTRIGNPNALPQNYARATVTMINAFFGGMCPAASWVVDETGFPIGYGTPPNANFDPNWSTTTPLHSTVAGFLAWLDATVPGWDANLRSTCP